MRDDELSGEPGNHRQVDPSELDYYASAASDEGHEAALTSFIERIANRPPGTFASPVEAWLDAPYDSVAQAECYAHVGPIVRAGGTVLQLGGSGSHAVKALLGGATEAYLVTPVEEEGTMGRRLAARFGVKSRLTTVVALAEDLPADLPTVDAVISGGCFHHTDVAPALRMIERVLSPGGRFAAWDPWRAPLYGIGVALLGQREPGVHCRPLNRERVRALSTVFPESEIRLHGALFRYPLIALSKAGIRPSLERLHRWAKLDDRLASRSKRLAGAGSSVAILATKADRPEPASQDRMPRQPHRPDDDASSGGMV
jgi:SAM-dependent methyltransferase